MSELIRWIDDGAGIVANVLAAEQSAMTVANYQDAAAAQITSTAEADNDVGTICGYHPEAYFYLGAREERAEITEVDRLYPAYNRAAALLVKPGQTYPHHSPEAASLHRKEFGDLLWYVANLMNYHDVSLAQVTGVPETTTLPDLDVKALEFAAKDNGIFMDPGGHFLTTADTFLSTVRNVMRHTRPNAHPVDARRMLYFTGQLMIASSVVLQLRLDAGLADVLPANLLKVEGRINKGNVFDANGGDTR